MEEMSKNLARLQQERKELSKRLQEMDEDILSLQREIRHQKLENLLCQPIADPDYEYVLKNLTSFQTELNRTCSGISYQLQGVCAESVVEEMINTFPPSRDSGLRGGFRGFLDSLVFNMIWELSRKTDAESYFFTEKKRVHRFLDKRLADGQ